MVEGEKAEFTCSVSKETYEVKWLKDNVELEAGDKYQMVSDGKKRTLVIKNCELRDEGGYVVMIGQTRASASLAVRGKPHPHIIYCTRRQTVSPFSHTTSHELRHVLITGLIVVLQRS